jgi:hypothetical protein
MFLLLSLGGMAKRVLNVPSCVVERVRKEKFGERSAAFIPPLHSTPAIIIIGTCDIVSSPYIKPTNDIRYDERKSIPSPFKLSALSAMR